MKHTMGDFDAGAVITSAISGLGDTLTDVAGPALLIGASVLGLTFGWKLVKRFVN